MFEDKLGGGLYLEAKQVYKEIIRVLPPEGWVHYSQCIHAAGGIVANIAEGNGRQSNKGGYYRQFLQMARGSAYEVVAWLQLGIIDGKIPTENEEPLGRRLINLADSILAETLNEAQTHQETKGG